MEDKIKTIEIDEVEFSFNANKAFEKDGHVYCRECGEQIDSEPLACLGSKKIIFGRRCKCDREEEAKRKDEEMAKEEIKLLCEYHDIGKIGVPHHILLKEGSLNEEEWIQMKRHSEIGYHIIRSAKETLAVDELILIHHERWDGSGYPRQLKGLQIPLSVRLFGIADAYVAMVEGRPYKDNISHNEAIEEIRKESGAQFDPSLVEVFEKIKDDI